MNHLKVHRTEGSTRPTRQEGHRSTMIGTSKSRTVAAASAAALLALTAAACSKSPSGNTPAASTGSSTAAAITLSGSVTFNQDNLAKLDAALKTALAGKNLS